MGDMRDAWDHSGLDGYTAHLRGECEGRCPYCAEQPRCDVCGRYVASADLDGGAAVRELDTPDSAFARETYTTLCRDHRRKGR
jgi:methionyl-tRNA synthetase